MLMIASVLSLPAFVFAHHSAAAYESTTQVTVPGTVTEFHFVNPHVLIHWTANDKTWLDRAGHPHSEQLHLVVRFRRVDANTLTVDLTIEDPIAYTQPLKFRSLRFS